MNNHLLKLYLELDFLYKNIISVCVGCQDHDCEGYVCGCSKRKLPRSTISTFL